MENEGSVAEPETPVSVGTGVDLPRGVQNERTQRLLVKRRAPVVGEPEPAAAGEGLGPSRGEGLRPSVERNVNGNAARPISLKAEQRRRRGHADVANCARLVAAILEMDEHVTSVVGGAVMTLDRLSEGDAATIDPPGAPRFVEADLVDEADPLGVIGPQREDEPAAAGRLAFGLEAADDFVSLAPGLHARGQRKVRRSNLRHHAQILELQRLLGVVGARRQEAVTVIQDDPGIQRPPVPKRGEEAARVDDRQAVNIGQTNRSPVAMAEIDVRDREGARDEGGVARIELTLDPKRPRPIKIVLDDPAVDQATSVEDDASPQKLDRLGDLRGLGKAAQAPGDR